MTAPTPGAVLDAETTALIFRLAERGHKMPGCDNWRAVSMCREIAGLARPTPEGFKTDYAPTETITPAQPEPGAGKQQPSVAMVWLNRGAYPASLIDALNGYITGGSTRCLDTLKEHGVTVMQRTTEPEPGAGELEDTLLDRLGQEVDSILNAPTKPRNEAVMREIAGLLWDGRDALTQAQATIARLEREVAERDARIVQLTKNADGYLLAAEIHLEACEKAEARALSAEADAAKVREAVSSLLEQIECSADVLEKHGPEIKADGRGYVAATLIESYAEEAKRARQALAAQAERRA